MVRRIRGRRGGRRMGGRRMTRRSYLKSEGWRVREKRTQVGVRWQSGEKKEEREREKKKKEKKNSTIFLRLGEKLKYLQPLKYKEKRGRPRVVD